MKVKVNVEIMVRGSAGTDASMEWWYYSAFSGKCRRRSSASKSSESVSSSGCESKA